MDLRDLFRGMDLVVPTVSVSDVTTHSRRASRGSLFLACAGERRHGLDFLDAALAAGVRAVAWEPASGRAAPSLPEGVVGLRVPGLRAKLGVVANRFFRAPSSQVPVTAVTGTNGKSTTAWLAANALTRIGQRAGYSGTLGFGLLPGALQASSLTTPGCIELHRRLRQMVDTGAAHVLTEVSSHALDQDRMAGIAFRVAALTNLSRDHLDYHGSMEAYAEAKARLFLGNGIRSAVINVGDAFGARLADRLAPDIELFSVALVAAAGTPPRARLAGQLTGVRRDGLGMRFSGDFGTADLTSPLWGRFNAENLVVTAGILVALGVSLGNAAAALEHCAAPPGRMQRLSANGSGPEVIIDFAHTPDALAQVLAAVREHCRGRVWCVFGCGGERDTGKRAPMGATASALADRAIVTTDNPRHEAAAGIIDDIVAGVADRDGLEIIEDRRTAIHHAIASAAPDDVVIVAGKGHEAVQIFGDRSEPFSDVAVARDALGHDA